MAFGGPEAVQKADEVAAKLVQVEVQEPGSPEELTLKKLFDIYGEEMTPTKGEYTQKHDRRAAAMFQRFLGEARKVTALSLRDWNRFIRDRGAGRITAAGGGTLSPVGNRMIEQDLRFILAVFNWATMADDGEGGVLLGRNPFKGYPLPKEKNPLRVVLKDAEYGALLQVSGKVDWRFRLALVLAHETGHRIGAVRKLRWSDVDLERGLVRWRAENEKTGYEHHTPVTQAAQGALEDARANNPGIGEAPVMPAPENPSKPMSRHLARDWWICRFIRLLRPVARFVPSPHAVIWRQRAELWGRYEGAAPICKTARDSARISGSSEAGKHIGLAQFLKHSTRARP